MKMIIKSIGYIEVGVSEASHLSLLLALEGELNENDADAAADLKSN